MEFIVNKDGIRIKEETKNKYEQTRKRITKFYNKYDMSDKEIIEYLIKEIEQYRERIQKQEEHIKQHADIEEIIRDIVKKEYRIRFQTIEGNIKAIQFKEKNIQNIYKLIIITEDMYEIMIDPIAEGTIRDIFKSMTNGNSYFPM